MLGAPSTRLPRPEWALGEAPMPLMRELPPPSPFPICKVPCSRASI